MNNVNRAQELSRRIKEREVSEAEGAFEILAFVHESSEAAAQAMGEAIMKLTKAEAILKVTREKA